MRFAPILVGLGLLAAGGVVHGLWNGRWSSSTALPDAAAKLDGLPEDVGAWKGEAHEQDPEALALTGAAGHYSRTFTDPTTKDKVLVMLLCGKPSHMVVHRPEDCYRAAGYEMAGPAIRIKVKPEGGQDSEMFTGVFGRDEAGGPTQLRIFWSWLGSREGAKWEAPANPRFHFARQPVLYKLYVIRNTAGMPVPAGQDPAVRLLGELLPILDKALIPQ